MLIFWEKRLVFLATPKAGSTAIEAALEGLANLAVQRPAQLKHADLRSYRRFIEPWLSSVSGEKFTTVALMRDPLAWLQSWYRFQQRDDLDDAEDQPSHASFAEFALAYQQNAIPALAQIGSQTRFLTDGADRVDRIFRYEDIDCLTEFLEERLDCALSLPRVNVPPEVDVSLDAAAEACLREFMAEDFRLRASL